MYVRSAQSWVLMAVVLLAACDLRPRNSTGVDNPVTGVVVYPDSLTLDPQQSFQFRVFGRTQAGDSVPVSVRWSASAGSISAAGVYTADTSAADATVTATLANSTVNGSSNVKKNRLVQLVIDPKSTTLTVGGLQQFSVFGRKSAGDSVSVAVTYSGTGGAISGAGAYTAGQTAGNYRVIAKQNGGSLADTSAVTVSAVAPPPPPPPSPPGTVNDLAVASPTANSVTLSFTEVNDGTGQPATYDVRFAIAPLTWSSGQDVSQGTCQLPMAGTVIGARRTCTVLGLAAATAYQFQLVAFRGTLNVDAVFGGVSNVGNATTSASTAPVATVAVSPASASIGVAGTQQLTATLRDAGGNVLTGRTVTWASTNTLVATVSGSGLVSGLLAGSVTITATSEGQNGPATITVTALPPPPPPPPPPGWTHEPSGFTVIEDNGWESGLLGNWTLYYQTADKPITVEPITDSPIGEAKAFQIGYLAGLVGGGGTEARFEIPAAYQRNEIFVGYWVQVNPQWQGHNSGINKMIFLDDGAAAGTFSAMWYEMFGSGSSPLDLYVVNQSGSGPGGFHENVNQIEFTRGVWHKVEIYQHQGSPGIVRVWVDDVLAVDRSDVYTNAAPLDAVAISGIWGGVGDVKLQFDYMRFDRIHISVH